jgi:hypothetical protein
MMRTARAIVKRLGSVTSASTPRWGRLDVQAMLTHLKRSALMALGELPVARKSPGVLQAFPVKHLILHVVPFPKNAPTAPELLAPTEDGTVDAIQSEIVILIDRIGAGPRDGAGPVHPLFGRLSYQDWGVATYKHTDHHLRQFRA